MNSSVTQGITGAAIEAHRHLGPGLLETACEQCSSFELSRLGLSFQRQLAVPVQYQGLKLDCSYRLDLLVEEMVIGEINAVEQALAVHPAQLLSYLKAAKKPVGLLINFNVATLKEGMHRVSVGKERPQ